MARIINEKEFAEIIKSNTKINSSRPLVVDCFTDWCPPCKELESILEKIAKEKSAMVKVYKINIDRNKGLANSFRIGGIPHVVFFKNKETVLALTGLYPKNMYLKAVERFSAATEP